MRNLITSITVLFVLNAYGQEVQESKEFVNEHGLDILVSTCAEYYLTIPLSEMPVYYDQPRYEVPDGIGIIERSDSSNSPNSGAVNTSSHQFRKTKAPLVNFPGQVFGAPPDPTGAAGPNHFVQTINSNIQVWDKTGNPLTPSINLTSIFGGDTIIPMYSDPITLYDRHADRWFIGATGPFGNDTI
ncbi:hypothetical protein JYT21_00400, partial [bacterium AH-315-B15]|nr:hypothetical protein [bacterium AH-315-B15]